MTGTVRSLTLTWLALLVLLAATMATAYLKLGAGNLALNLGIATAKAVLVAVVFMHLRQSHAVIRAIAVAGVLWLMILLGLGMSDFIF
jgi:cytochrome c oxidase subunit 4